MVAMVGVLRPLGRNDFQRPVLRLVAPPGVYDGLDSRPNIAPSTQCASGSKDRPGIALGAAHPTSQEDKFNLEQKREKRKNNGVTDKGPK